MAAYVVVNIEITDPGPYAEYKRGAGESLAKFGGRFLARGGEARRLEGDYEPKRVVILEFESMERAQAWWDSDDYAGPKALRQSAATTDMILVEGV